MKTRKFKQMLGAATAAALSVSAVGFGGVNVGAEETSAPTYTITIPSTLKVNTNGWNALGEGIKVKGNLGGKDLKISASSENNFNLVNSSKSESKKTAKISYTFKNSENDEEVTSWELSGETFNGETALPIGINVENYDTKPAGKYIDIVTFTASLLNTVHLDKLEEDYEAQDGDRLTGELPINKRITIADEATVTLKNATIKGSNDVGEGEIGGITANGNATIILEGNNAVNAFGEHYSPGIYIPKDKTLSFKGEGSITVKAGQFAAGIGSGAGGTGRIMRAAEGGNIVIESGTFNVSGGTGIGAGYYGTCGTITIKGGDITANVVKGDGAGIGSGVGYEGDSSCGDIIISGGTVKASGGEYAPGIGAGQNTNLASSSCGNIEITSGVSLTATKGEYAPYSIGRGLNAQNGAINGTIGTITIGGEVTGEIAESPYTYPPQN